MIKFNSIKALLFIVVVFFSSCTSDNQKAAATDSPDVSVNTVVTDKEMSSRDFTYAFTDQAKKFRVSNARGTKLELQSGTNIQIPGNCFVDASGHQINSEVEVVFEEFLTAGSIIASQINMKYDSSGKVSDFESAGMFRINAYDKGAEVFIAKDKSIEVSLATNDTDKNFNSYYSKKDGSDWQYLDRSMAVSNPDKTETLQAPVIARTMPQPKQPAVYSANGKYFDLNLSRSSTKDLEKLLGIVWEYAGNDKRNDPAVSKTNFNRDWDFVSIQPAEGDKRGVYNILLQSKDTTIRTQARPVYRGAVLDAANEEFAQELGEFNTRMNQLKNENAQAVAESSFLRTLQVKNLGLYNYDRQYHYEDAVPVLANFNFGNDSLKNYPITVFLITGNGMAVVKYPPSDYKKFMYSRSDENKLIAILPNQEICTFSAVRFKKEAPVFPKNAADDFTFNLHHTGVKATKAADIDRVLSTI